MAKKKLEIPSPVKAISEQALRDLCQSVAALPGFENSWIDQFRDTGRQVLGAPSNNVAIEGNSVMADAVSSKGKFDRVDLLKLNSGSGYGFFYACENCGYEQKAQRVPLRERIGGRAPKTDGYKHVCRVCSSIGVYFPELAAYLAPDPRTGVKPDPFTIQARVQGVKAWFKCSDPGCDKVVRRHVARLCMDRHLPKCNADAALARGNASKAARTRAAKVKTKRTRAK